MARRSINLSNKAERVWEWIFPSVVIALVPVLAQYILNFLSRGFNSYNSYDFLENVSPHGELLIVSVALVAESVSEMWRRQIPRWQKNSIGSLCIVFVILATYIFAGLPVTPTNTVDVSTLSVNMFVYGCIGCVVCKVAGRS